MPYYLKYLNIILVFGGIVFLGFSFYRGLVYSKIVPVKKAAKYWQYSTALISFFILGYFIYLVHLILQEEVFLSSFLVSSVFFLGSLYVFFTAKAGMVFVDEVNRHTDVLKKEKYSLDLKVKERTEDLEKINQKLKEMDEMRRNFVSYTAHELRAPLSVFRWSTEMLRNEDLGKINLKQREILDQVYESNERLMSLVNDLLDVSRLDEAKIKLELEPCQLEEIIDAAAGSLAVEIRKKKINLIWKKPASLLPKVKGDKKRILQMILNILENAVKFTPNNRKIRIGFQATDQLAPQEILKKYGFQKKNKKYIKISIDDEGLGIPKSEQKKIFSRFFRGSNVKRLEIGGTGLGMAIVFELVRLHEGAVWFESEEGRGTTFYITLPVA